MTTTANAQITTADMLATDARDISAYAEMVTAHLSRGEGTGTRAAYWAQMNTLSGAERHVWADECRAAMDARRW